MMATSSPLPANTSQQPQRIRPSAQKNSPFRSCRHNNRKTKSPSPTNTCRRSSGRHVTNATTRNSLTCASAHQRIANYRARLRHHLGSRDLDEAKKLYADIVTCSSREGGSVVGVVLESMLVDAFMKSGRVDDAFWVFDVMPEKNVFTWTSMISGCCKNDYPEFLPTAVYLFIQMLETGVCPNDYACNAVLGAAGGLGDLAIGQQIHSLAVRLGFEVDVRTACCLIDFYSKCGSNNRASLVFDKMIEPDLVAYTSLISGFCNNGLVGLALVVFDQLMMLGIRPNEHTLASILTGCDLAFGQQIHGYMVKCMFDKSLYTASSLLELYSRNSMFELANLVFLKLPVKNVVTWSSMISCCIQNKEVDYGIELFLEMICLGIKPNVFTFSTAIAACGLSNNAISLGQQLHCLIVKLNMSSDNRVSNALITMYARNGKMDEMEKTFDKLTDLDSVSWSSIISGYFHNGFHEKAIELLCQLLSVGDKPNEYSLSTVLGACASLALLFQGKQFHCLSLKLGCEFHTCVGNALVNMYAKCGCINDAVLIFNLMPTHDLMSWNSLIHGYVHLGMGNKALQVFNKMTEPPNQSTFVGVLSACSDMGYLDEALGYFKSMEEHKVTPSPCHYACLIDMMGRAGRFVEAMSVIQQMPYEPDVSIWKSLLGSCKLHKNIHLGRIAAERAATLSPKDSASYIMLSNLHTMHGEWDEAKAVRTIMNENDAKKEAAQSWITIRNAVHPFVAGDNSHPRTKDIYKTLEELVKEMKEHDY